MFVRIIAGIADAKCTVMVGEDEDGDDQVVDVSIEMEGSAETQITVTRDGEEQHHGFGFTDNILLGIRARNGSDFLSAVIGRALVEAGQEMLRLSQPRNIDFTAHDGILYANVADTRRRHGRTDV